MIQSQTSNLIAWARSSRMLRAGIWYTAGNLFTRALSFAALPIFTRLLSPTDFGTVAVFLTWIAIFIIGSSLYTYAVPLRARFDFEEDYPQFISALTSLGILASLVFTIVLALLPADLTETLFGLPRDLLILAAAIVPIVTPFRIMVVAWQAEAKARQYMLSTITHDVLVIVVSIVLIVLPDYTPLDYAGVWGRVAGILIVRAVFGLIFLPKALRGGVFFNWKYWRYALVYAVPLIPHALSGEVLANFDRVMISQYIGPYEAGVYSFAYQLGAVIALIAAALSAAWFPWFYRHMKSENYDLIRRRTVQYLLGFTGLTAVALVMGIFMVPLLAPQSYQEAVKIVPLVMAGGYFVFLQYFFVAVETHVRKTWYMSMGTLLTAGLNVGLNWYFIPRYGFLAAGWTTLVSYVFLFLVHVGVVRFILRVERVNDLRMMILVSTAILLLSAAIYSFVSMA